MRSPPSARRDLFELAVGYILVLIAVWTPQPWTRYFFWLGLLWVLFVTLRSGESYRSLGLSLAGLRRSWRIVAIALLGALVTLGIAYRLGTLHLPFTSTTPRWHAWGYLFWALVQQFILQDYFLARLLRVLPSRSSAVVAATALFALAHLPNPLLTIATLLWGTVACVLFLRYRDLYSLGIAHAILGLCVAFAVPNAVHAQMRVGLGYLEYKQHAHPVQRSQRNQIVSTSEWVIADAKMRCSERHARP